MKSAGSPADRPIELRVREIGQIFHSLDPLPFRERDLDAAVEEYVVGWAQELSQARPIEIIVHLPRSEAECEDARHIAEAMRNYFDYRAEAVGRELREMFRVGRISLLIGLAVLATCVVAGALMGDTFGDAYLGRFFNEGLVILGWVANWRPIQTFLYDWWPLAHRRRIFARLARAHIELRND